MKKLLLAVALFSAQPAVAVDKEYCAIVSGLAGTIATNRQQGALMVDMITKAGGNTIAEKLVVGAFETPRYSVEANQIKAAVKFQNKVYAECFKSLGK